MSLVTTAEMNTHIYPDRETAIDRDSAGLLQTAIDTAEETVQASMAKFNIVSLFSATGSGRSKYLMRLVKDIAVWEFIKLANPNINPEFWQMIYELAQKELDKLGNKKMPVGWPLATDPVNESDFIEVTSATQRPTRY